MSFQSAIKGTLVHVARFLDDPLGVRRAFRPDLRFGQDEV